MNLKFGMIVALAFLLVIGKSYSSEDPFLSWFDDQFDEIYDSPAILEVEGTIPDYLVGGSLFRSGPSIGHTSKRNYTSFVDFFGRISKWSFTSKSEVKFQSALIKSLQYNASNNVTDIPTHITAEKPEPKFSGLVNLDDMDNTNVFMYAFRNDDSNSILTFTDFYQSNDIDIPSMRTLGNTQFEDSITPIWSSSHPQEYQDPESDSQDIVLVNWFGTKSIEDVGHMKLSVFKMGKDLTRKPVGSVEVPFLPYSIHSLAVVGDWAIVQVGPVTLGFIESGFNDCLSCSAKSKLDTDPTRVYVFDLCSSANPDEKPIAIFEIPPPHNFFSFHQGTDLYTLYTLYTPISIEANLLHNHQPPYNSNHHQVPYDVKPSSMKPSFSQVLISLTHFKLYTKQTYNLQHIRCRLYLSQQLSTRVALPLLKEAIRHA